MAKIELIGNVARKCGPAALLAMEAEKTERAAALAADSGLFHVPRVVRFDSFNGVLETEWIPNLQTVASILANGQGNPDLLEAVGIAVAHVHTHLQLPESMSVPVPRGLMAEPADNVYLHGDFSLGNVCFDPSRNKVVIVDWSGAPILGGMFSFGPRYFDLLWFSAGLFLSVPVSRQGGWGPGKQSEAFLRGYREVVPSLEWPRFKSYATRLDSVFRGLQFRSIAASSAWKRPVKRLWQARLWNQWQAFLYRPSWGTILTPQGFTAEPTGIYNAPISDA
jgi:hypothetical protein